ncbi:reverse transcriptase [Gossypium australe]|uniref:Reverse transcriptase n=1 Tax=Gossypium australe TaxID=47621 RepID=A0A5B6UXL1_9ROSI|nr:reverse transcriptase [Gossypium australe]
MSGGQLSKCFNMTLSDMLALLADFDDVFWTPKELPPPRLKDHRIPLLDEKNVVKQLKEAICQAPMLVLPDFQETFCVETDACRQGVGVVLQQKGRPVAFFSKALGIRHQALFIYDKKMLTVMLAVKKWHPYVLASPRLLQLLPILDRVWAAISMDSVEGLLASKGKSTILVVVDRLIKYDHFLALAHPFNALTVAQEYQNQELFKQLGIKLHLSTTYHLQTNSQTEILNKCLEGYLRCMTERPSDWVHWLLLAEWWYNTTHHSTIKSIPYESLYGQEPPLHLPYLVGSSKVEKVVRSLQHRETMRKLLRFHLKRAQERMKQMADKKRPCREFQVEDLVYL